MICGHPTKSGEGCKVSIDKHPCRFHKNLLEDSSAEKKSPKQKAKTDKKPKSPKQKAKTDKKPKSPKDDLCSLWIWARRDYGNEIPTLSVITRRERIKEVMEKMVRDESKREAARCNEDPPDPETIKEQLEWVDVALRMNKAPELDGVYVFEIYNVKKVKKIPDTLEENTIYILE